MMNSELHFRDSVNSVAFYKAIIDSMINAFALHKIVLDDEGKPCDYEFVDVNPSFENLTGLKKAEIIGRKVSEVIPNIKEDVTDWIGVFGNVAANGTPVSFESFSKSLGKWFLVNAFSPGAGYFITVFSDISQIKHSELYLREKNEQLLEAQSRLQYLADHDSLTGLPNRTALDKNSRMGFEKDPDSKRALFYIEFDNFKFINNTLGHVFGEKLIIEISKRLSSLLQNDNTLYRLDGAEFILFLNGFAYEDELKEYAERIIQCFKRPLTLEGNKLHTSVSIGIATYPEQGTNTDELIKSASISMSYSKTLGKNKFVFYEEAMLKAVNDRLMMDKYLHTALENHEFEIYYQPQLDLITKKICGFEALLRWRNPELGFVSPEVFVGVAESNYLIIPIGNWVLRNACYFIKKLQTRGFKDFTVAVNVSIIQLIQEDFVDTVFKILDLLDLEPKYLELEITESVLLESYEALHKKLECLRERGVIIALDDFGKGYSSLGELQDLPIDTLKIDKVFTDSILRQDGHICIADMIIMLGRKMGLTVLAEGVETAEQMNYLIENQCHKAQGYLFSKPVPENEILRMLNANTAANTYICGFEWRDEYSINISSIDAQHKKMFAIGNKLFKMAFSRESSDDGSILALILRELGDYIEYHFRCEESFMRHHGYTFLETHINEHKIFVEKVNKAQHEFQVYNEKEYLMLLIDMVAVWITNHILHEDRKFGHFLARQESGTDDRTALKHHDHIRESIGQTE